MGYAYMVMHFNPLILWKINGNFSFHRLYLYLNKCQIPNQTYNLLPKHFNKGMQQSMKIFLPLPTTNHPGTIVFRILSIRIESFFLKRCWRIGKKCFLHIYLMKNTRVNDDVMNKEISCWSQFWNIKWADKIVIVRLGSTIDGSICFYFFLC